MTNCFNFFKTYSKRDESFLFSLPTCTKHIVAVPIKPPNIAPHTKHITPIFNSSVPLYYFRYSVFTLFARLSRSVVIMIIEYRNTKKPVNNYLFTGLNVGIYLSFRAASRRVFSAQASLTSVFGMGTGGPSPQSTPTIVKTLHNRYKPDFKNSTRTNHNLLV